MSLPTSSKFDPFYFLKSMHSIVSPWTKRSAELIVYHGLRGIMLTEHFSLREFLTSKVLSSKFSPGISIFPEDSSIVDNIYFLCLDILEPVRVAFGRPLIVSSGYRPKYLNTKVRGASTSLHLLGKAVDLSFSSLEHLSEFTDFLTDFLSDPRNENVKSNIRELIINRDKLYVHLAHV